MRFATILLLSLISVTAQAQQTEHLNLRLSQFSELCSDIADRDQADAMVATAYRSLLEWDRREAEPAIRFLDISYRMLIKVKEQSNAPMNCASIWAIYVSLRQDGFSPAEAEQEVPAVLAGLYGARD